MDFEITHTFDADRDVVEKAMFESELAPFLIKNMSLVTSIEVVEKNEDDKQIRRKVKYEPVPMIKKVGTKEVEPRWMTWIEHSTFNRAAHTITFENVPVVHTIAELMDQKGTIRFEQLGPGRTKRVISGVLKIKFPILGRIAERIIYPNAEKILEEEARAFSAYLKQRKA